MSGVVTSLFSKRQYVFPSTTTVVAVKTVDVSQFTEATLAVRVHANPAAAGSSTLVVRARATLPSPEDPAVDFVAVVADGVTTVTTITIGSTAVGTLLRATLPGNFGGFLRIEVIGTVNGATVDATISADLVGKA